MGEGVVTPDRVVRALERDPDLLTGVINHLIDMGHITVPKPAAPTEGLAHVEWIEPITLDSTSEVVILVVPPHFPAGIYLVEITMPGAAFEPNLLIQQGTVAYKVTLGSRDGEPPTMFTHRGVMRLQEDDQDLPRQLRLRLISTLSLPLPKMAPIPQIALPDGGWVKIQHGWGI